MAERLIQVHHEALADTATRSKLAAQGLMVSDQCGAPFLDTVRQETACWARVVKATGFSASE